jgi:[ribosomal protein S18]-alanine N-acetyltransferase
MIPSTDDVDGIMHVMDAAFDPEFGEAWNRRQLTDALLMPGTHYRLIASDYSEQPFSLDQCAGFYLSRRVLDEEELLLFAIAPRFRRKGLGRRLLERMIADATNNGIKRIFLEMREGNPAQLLYEAIDFQVIGMRPGYYRTRNGTRLNAITQELHLAKNCAFST